MMTIPAKELMTLPEFLGQYSIGRTTLYREVAAGKLRITKVRRRSYITRDDAQAWLMALHKSGGTYAAPIK